MKNIFKKSSLMRIIAVLLMAAVSLSAFTGCRDSDAFTQIVYNQDSEEETDDDEMMDNDEENVDNPDEDIFSVVEVDDSESTRDYDNSVAQVGEGTSGVSRNVAYDSDASSFYTSNFTRDETSTSDEEGLDTVESTESENTSDTDEVNEDSYGSSGVEEETTEEETTEEEDYGSTTFTTDTELDDVNEEDVAATETEDETEENIEIDPNEDVTEEIPTGTTAAAVGEIAILVQMLGGDGVLIATSNSFNTSMVSGISAASVFADELSENLLYLGDIEGFSEMSTSMFDALVEAAPDIIFMTTDDYNDWTTYYNKLSSERRLAFTEAEIQIVKVLDLDTGSKSSDAGTNLLYDVELIAESLGDRSEYGGQNAQELAESYAEWYDNVMDSLESGGSLYSCYIHAWDEEVVVKVSSDSVSYSTADSSADEGMAIARINLYLATSFYMSAAGVTATNSEVKNAASSSTKLYYVMTLMTNLGFKISGGLSSSVNIIKQSLSGTSGNDCLLTEAYGVGYLGSEDFPAVLVSCESIKTRIENSRDGGGLFSDSLTREYFKLAANVDTVAIASTEYDVYVVPYGVGNWAEGSAESPLFSAWVGYKFYGSYDESTLIYLMQQFYSNFYRYDLSESEAKTILAGRQD